MPSCLLMASTEDKISGQKSVNERTLAELLLVGEIQLSHVIATETYL